MVHTRLGRSNSAQRACVTSLVRAAVKIVKQSARAAMAEVLQRMEIEATVNGFRSSFKDWASETTGFPNEVTEMALAHAVKNRTEAAYRRGDLLDKRRALMRDWAQRCAGGAVVVPLPVRMEA